MISTKHPFKTVLTSTAGAAFLKYGLPYFLKQILNKTLKEYPGYDASVKSIRWRFWSGRLELIDVVINKKISREWKTPFITIPKLSLALSLKHLLSKQVVADVVIEDLHVAIDLHEWHSSASRRPNPERRRDAPSSWRSRILHTVPFLIQVLRVHRGTVTFFSNIEKDPLTIQQIEAKVQNMTNSLALASTLVSRAEINGQILSDGVFTWRASGYFFDALPSFKTSVQARGIPLLRLRNLFRHYFAVDVSQGILDVFGEAEAQHGKVKGHLKPFFDHLCIQSVRRPTFWRRLKMVWIKFLLHFMRNSKSDRIATRINFEGSITQPHLNVVNGMMNVLQNVFGNAFTTRLDLGFKDIFRPTKVQGEINDVQSSTASNRWWSVLKESFLRWLADDVPRMAAALSYYTCFSLAPLLLFIIAVVGLLFGRDAAQGHILRQLTALVGKQSAQTIQTMIAAAWQPSKGIMAALISVGTLLIGAFGVLSELKSGLNHIMKVPESGNLGDMVLDRAKYLGFILGIGFLLIVSLAISTALSAFSQQLGHWLPFPSVVLHLTDVVLSVGVIAVLFTVIFRFLPNARLPWRVLGVGSVFTAILFTLGKFGLGMYLGRSSTASSYGAAGSVLIVLLWVYYSALLLYYGAEFTQVYSET